MATYNTITVTSNETFTPYDSPWNGVMENVLFDQTAGGATAELDIQSGDAIVRNVAIVGECDGISDHNNVKVEVNSGSRAIIENFWMGDGSETGDSNNGVQVGCDHGGTVVFHNCYVSGFDDNGIYASIPTEPGSGCAGGTVLINESHGYNNDITQFRIGGSDHVIRDSVMDVDGTDFDLARGMRAENVSGNYVEGSHIDTPYTGVQTKDGGSVTLRDCEVDGSPDFDDDEGSITTINVGSSPDTSRPAGVPADGDEAASGEQAHTYLAWVAEDTGDSSATMDVTLTLDGEYSAFLGPLSERTDEISTDGSGNTTISSPNLNLDGADDDFYVAAAATPTNLVTDGGSLASITWDGTTYTESEFRNAFDLGGSTDDGTDDGTDDTTTDPISGTVPDDRPGSNLTELNVSDGDNLDAELSGLSDDEQIYIPPGTYSGDFTDIFNISASNATIYGDPDGVDIEFSFPDTGSNESEPSLSAPSGTLRLENINIVGKMGHGQHRWQLSVDGTLEMVNVNFVDGSEPCSDSFAHRLASGSDGHVMFKNCYYGNFGNSTFYMTDHNASIEVRGCAFRSGGSNLRMDGPAEIYNTVNYYPEPPTGFCEGPDGPSDCANGTCGRTPRMTKFENDGTILMENCDGYVTDTADDDNGWTGDFGDGPVIDFTRAESDLSVTYRNCRFSNEIREIWDTASAPDAVAANSTIEDCHVWRRQSMFSGDPIDGNIITGSDADPPRVTSEADLQNWIWTPIRNVGDPSGPTGDTAFTTLEWVAEDTGTTADTMTASLTFDDEYEAYLGPQAESGEDEVTTDSNGNTVLRSNSFNLDGAVDDFHIDATAVPTDLVTDGGTLAQITWKGKTYTESEFRSQVLDQTVPDFATEVIPADTHREIQVNSNETLDNVLFDITADGASIHIDASEATGWEIRNVGIKGKMPDTDTIDGVNNVILAGVNDTNGTGLIENVYLGDGIASTPAHGGGIFVDSFGDYHVGELIIRNVHVARWPDNGLYGSDVDDIQGAGAGGPVTVEDSFFHNNNIAGVRLGTDDSTVTNTTVTVDGDVPAAPNGTRPRGFWLRENSTGILLDTCRTWQSGDEAAEAISVIENTSATATDTGIEGTVKVDSGSTLTENNTFDLTEIPQPPDGVPLTAEEAARGAENIRDYDVHVIPAGGHRSVTVGSGETLEGVVYDITADGASVQIKADSGGPFTIRDLAVFGNYPSENVEGDRAIRLHTDVGNTGVVDNVYLGDGTNDDATPGPRGIYIPREHAGTIDITRCTLRHWAENAIHASEPGYPADNPHGLPEGGGGTVHIRKSYASDCNDGHYRIGSSGSTVENSVAAGGAVGDRGVYARFNDTEAIQCDLAGHSAGDVACGTDSWPSGADATLTLTDCRFESIDTSFTNQGTVSGSSVGTPDTVMPNHVPHTYDDAAGGTTEATNQPPTAAFTMSPSPATVNETVTFDGTDSSDPDGVIDTYEWDIAGDRFGSHSVSTTFSESGSYTISLAVTDDQGKTDTETKTLQVEEPDVREGYVVTERSAYARFGEDAEPPE